MLARCRLVPRVPPTCGTSRRGQGAMPGHEYLIMHVLHARTHAARFVALFPPTPCTFKLPRLPADCRNRHRACRDCFTRKAAIAAICWALLTTPPPVHVCPLPTASLPACLLACAGGPEGPLAHRDEARGGRLLQCQRVGRVDGAPGPAAAGAGAAGVRAVQGAHEAVAAGVGRRGSSGRCRQTGHVEPM